MEKDLKQLENELDFSELDDYNRERVINVFKSWKMCCRNQVVISNVKDQTKKKTLVRIDDCIYIDGIKTHENISSKSTIFFSNCADLNILILNKINHIIIEKSDNINLKSTSGIIGGIDTLHSNNINIIVINKDVFYISFGEVSSSCTYIDRSLALNTLISTLECYSINFVFTINELIEKVKYITNLSLFSGFSMMMFIKNEVTGIFELHYINQDSENSQHKGIIYPMDI
jgi:hypothetical protein